MKTDLPKCEDVRGRLTLYLDDELRGEERATIETHLSECEACASIFARELEFLNGVRESGPLNVASRALRARVDEILGERPTRPRGLRYGWLVATAAGLLAIFLPV